MTYEMKAKETFTVRLKKKVFGFRRRIYRVLQVHGNEFRLLVVHKQMSKTLKVHTHKLNQIIMNSYEVANSAKHCFKI